MVAGSPSSKSSSRPSSRANTPPPNTVMPIVVRGKEILCRYVRSSPTLAFFAAKPDFESLEWFLRELKKDLANEGGTKLTRKGQETKPDEEQQIIEELMEDLRGTQTVNRLGSSTLVRPSRS